MANIKKRNHPSDDNRKDRSASSNREVSRSTSKHETSREKNNRHESDAKKTKRSDSINNDRRSSNDRSRDNSGGQNQRSNSNKSHDDSKSQNQTQKSQRSSSKREKDSASLQAGKSKNDRDHSQRDPDYGPGSLSGPRDTTRVKTNSKIINFDEKDYYQNLEFNQKSWLDRWNDTIKNIREKKNIIKSEPLTENEKNSAVNQMLISVLQLKRLNREIQYQIRKEKDECNAVSENCDQEDVLLQNVIYEQKHLAMTAKANLQFRSRYRAFSSLATEDQVMQDLATQGDTSARPAIDDHNMVMMRLGLELKNRNSILDEFATEESALENKKLEISEKEKKISIAENQISKILELTAPISESFGLETDFILDITKKAYKLKSVKLVHLFKQLASSLKNTGKLNSELKATKKFQIGLDDGNSKIKLTCQVKPGQTSPSSSQKTSTFKLIFMEHQDQIMVNCNYPNIAASLYQECEKYGYIENPTKVDTHIKKSLETGEIKEKSPSKSERNSSSNSRSGSVAPEKDTKEAAFTSYHWANEIAGQTTLKNSQGKLASPQKLIYEIDAALHLNFNNLHLISEYFLKRKYAPVSETFSSKFKNCKPFAKIERFDEMSYERYSPLALSTKVISEGLALPGQKYFVGRLARPEENISSRQVLNFTVCIPFTTGVGAIFSVEQNAKFTSQNKLALRLIESEINNNVGYSEHVLADQIYYLGILYDLLVEMESVPVAGPTSITAAAKNLESLQNLDEDSIESVLYKDATIGKVDAPFSKEEQKISENEVFTRTKSFSNEILSSAFKVSVPVYDPFSGTFID